MKSGSWKGPLPTKRSLFSGCHSFSPCSLIMLSHQTTSCRCHLHLLTACWGTRAGCTQCTEILPGWQHLIMGLASNWQMPGCVWPSRLLTVSAERSNSTRPPLRFCFTVTNCTSCTCIWAKHWRSEVFYWSFFFLMMSFKCKSLCGVNLFHNPCLWEIRQDLDWKSAQSCFKYRQVLKGENSLQRSP